MTEPILALGTSPAEIEYPASDRSSMAETDDHRDELAEIVFTLKRFFHDRDDVYVSGNLFVYYEEGDPRKRHAPDVFVVFGVPKMQRRTYRLWNEGRAPAMVIELTSKATRREDQETKPEIYALLGIEYLFLYDVHEEYLEPPLKGLHLGADGHYHSLAHLSSGRLPCPPLGLDLALDQERRLQFVDASTEEVVVRVLPALEATEGALHRESEARRRAEARVEEMKAEIERLRAELRPSSTSPT